MEELRVLEAGAYRDFRRAGFGASWRQTEVEELWLEQGFEAQAAWRWGREGGFPGALDAGAALCAWTRGVPGTTTRGAGQAFGMRWSPFPGIRAGAMARGLPLGPGKLLDRGGLEAGWAGQGTVWQWGLEARTSRGGGAPGQALRLDFRKAGPADWSALAALSLRPHPALEAAVGLAAAPFRASLGVRLSWAGTDYHQAWRHHRYLGAGWLASLGFARGPAD